MSHLHELRRGGALARFGRPALAAAALAGVVYAFNVLGTDSHAALHSVGRQSAAPPVAAASSRTDTARTGAEQFLGHYELLAIEPAAPIATF